MTEQTPADLLRQAAQQIRADVAEIVRPGDRWAVTTDAPVRTGYVAHVYAAGDPQWSGIADVIVGSGAEQHIARFGNPAVAVAVADWLETGADPYACVDREPMLRVARTYLGVTSEVPA